jgi:hypothetical protein
VSDHQVAAVQDVVADQSVEKVGDLARERVADFGRQGIERPK